MIDWTAFTWQAFATLLTGVLAVGAATWVAYQQISLKRQELRLQLFDRRKSFLDEYRRISSVWWRDAKLDDKAWHDFRNLSWEVRLLFDDPICQQMDDLVKSTMFQNHFRDLAKMHREDGLREEAQSALSSAHKHLQAISEQLTPILDQMVRATRIDARL